MNTRITSLTLAFALLFIVHAHWSTVFAQGLLTPPGAPAPTMKTLDQIESRTPISALPFTISTPGSYYLTGNLAATADGAAITVSADNVTIDLNGFTLAGGGTGTRAGINVPAARKGLSVRNGTLTGWTDYGIQGSNVSGGLYENLRLINNPALALYTGNSSNVRACVATGNTGDPAIYLGSYSLMSDCTASNNSHIGIQSNTACTIVNCAANANGSSGISTGDICTIANCTTSNNAGLAGINAASRITITHCTAASNNGTGILAEDEAMITECNASANGTGIRVSEGCTIKDCNVSFNGLSGLILFNRCHVTGCTFEKDNTTNTPGHAGLVIGGPGNRIDGNHFVGNNYAGLTATSSGSLIIRNSFSGAQYIVNGGNTLGPSIDLSASGGTISSASGSTGLNPWANISVLRQASGAQTSLRDGDAVATEWRSAGVLVGPIQPDERKIGDARLAPRTAPRALIPAGRRSQW